jgi:hypothetical protein
MMQKPRRKKHEKVPGSIAHLERRYGRRCSVWSSNDARLSRCDAGCGKCACANCESDTNQECRCAADSHDSGRVAIGDGWSAKRQGLDAVAIEGQEAATSIERLAELQARGILWYWPGMHR